MVMLTLLRLLLFARIIFSVLMAPTVASFGITVVVPFHCRTGAKCRPRRILSNGNDGGDGYILQLQLAMASSTRYGPRDGMIPPSSSSNDVNERSRLKSEFIQLLNTIIDGNKPVDEYPSLFTQNMDTIMKVIGDSNVGGGKSMLEEIMNEESQQSSETNDITTTTTDTTGNRVDQITDAVELILIFVESFVEQTKSMDDIYKQLLGKIFQSIAPSGANNMSGGETTPTATSISSLSTSSSSVGNMENQLDNLLSSEKAAFTPGFLRHVEGECIRISSLSTISPDSVKMLQILRLIQTRVLEELGKDIGEGAIVLGQLLGYDDESERLAVLDAGLTVRGVDFANELAALTEEALEGFKMAENVDAELVDRVRVIDERIRKFIARWTKDDFQ